MRILVLYSLREKEFRNTTIEHVFSFKKYSPENAFIYVNVGPKGIPFYLKYLSVDAIILHYTLLAGERFLPGDDWKIKIRGIEKLKGYKIAIPQDEYNYTCRLVDLFKKISIDLICTCFYLKKDIDFAYAQYLPENVEFLPVLTGYVDEGMVNNTMLENKLYKDRPIDIGYRASMLPAHLGKHGQLKYELIGLFNSRLASSGLNLDIKSSNNTLTREDPTAVKLGNTWDNFLMSCKAFIGCEGGSSLLDFDGSIQNRVYDYSHLNPEASFEEIEKKCFPGQDYNISCFAISPRHFEAVTTKTLQILVEGYYGNIFKPDVHYISLKKDFSNFNEVIATLYNAPKCQKIINQSYNDIVLSGLYSYRMFVNSIVELIKNKEDILPTWEPSVKQKIIILILKCREQYILLLNYNNGTLNPFILIRNFVYEKGKKPYRKYIKSHIKI